MTECGEGQRSRPLSPYALNVSYGQPSTAGQGADWFGPLTPTHAARAARGRGTAMGLSLRL